MFKNQQSYYQTYQLIIDILSFDKSTIDLEEHLLNSNVDWDLLVKIGSEHLVLPAIYCRLKQKKLLSFLPEELVHYLDELTQLNRERNRTLLNEAQQISKVFNSNEIHYVFIKGIALIAAKKYDDIGERMIGDIDILIATKDIQKAFDLLVVQGYNKSLSFSYEVKNFRHLPRQISENHLGAIELHNQLLKHKYNMLLDKDLVLSSKQSIDGVIIPSTEMLTRNVIYAHQINDRAFFYNNLKLKSLYDVMILGLSEDEQLIRELSNENYAKGFLQLASIFWDKIDINSNSFYGFYKKQMFIYGLKSPKFRFAISKSKSLYLGLSQRLKLLLFNKSYRTHVLKSKLHLLF